MASTCARCRRVTFVVGTVLVYPRRFVQSREESPTCGTTSGARRPPVRARRRRRGGARHGGGGGRVRPLARSTSPPTRRRPSTGACVASDADDLRAVDDDADDASGGREEAGRARRLPQPDEHPRGRAMQLRRGVRPDADEARCARVLRAMTNHSEEVQRLAMRPSPAANTCVLRAKLFTAPPGAPADGRPALGGEGDARAVPHGGGGRRRAHAGSTARAHRRHVRGGARAAGRRRPRDELHRLLPPRRVGGPRLGLKNWFAASRIGALRWLTEQSVARLCVSYEVPMCTLLSIGLERTPKWNERQGASRALVGEHGAAQGARAPGVCGVPAAARGGGAARRHVGKAEAEGQRRDGGGGGGGRGGRRTKRASRREAASVARPPPAADLRPPCRAAGLAALAASPASPRALRPLPRRAPRRAGRRRPSATAGASCASPSSGRACSSARRTWTWSSTSRRPATAPRSRTRAPRSRIGRVAVALHLAGRRAAARRPRGRVRGRQGGRRCASATRHRVGRVTDAALAIGRNIRDVDGSGGVAHCSTRERRRRACAGCAACQASR